MPDRPSVLVVGAGPTGLMLACELALAGVGCRVLERREQESNLTRAFGVHARTLELLDMRGEADELVSQGLRVPEVRPKLGRRPLRLSLNHPESRFPYVLIVAQASTEALLEQRAKALGVQIVLGAEVVGLRQDDAGVEVVVDGSQGRRTERADYVVGCDGAHSAVRRLSGVGFAGSAYSTHIMLADIRLSEDLPTAVGAFLGRAGIVLLPLSATGGTGPSSGTGSASAYRWRNRSAWRRSDSPCAVSPAPTSEYGRCAGPPASSANGARPTATGWAGSSSPATPHTSTPHLARLA